MIPGQWGLGVEEATRKLAPAPEDPAKYKIENSIEFETLRPVDRSSSIRTERQGMASFSGKWSKGYQLLVRGAKENDYIEFGFDNLEKKYKVAFYATKAVDYATVTFSVNRT